MQLNILANFIIDVNENRMDKFQEWTIQRQTVKTLSTRDTCQDKQKHPTQHKINKGIKIYKHIIIDIHGCN